MLIPALLVLVLLARPSSPREQSVGVRGALLCGTAPLNDTEVKLWDLDSMMRRRRANYLRVPGDPDDLMATGRTDGSGRFQLNGTEDEYTNIDPILRIYHNCNNRWPCKRVVKIVIPDTYISQGATAAKWYDVGTLNMEAKFPFEGRDCF